MFTEYLFLLGRLLLGGFFVSAGIGHFQKLDMMAGYAASKKVPMPKFGVAFTGLLLLLGGLGVILGVWVPYALGCLVLFLVPTTFVMHSYWNDTDPGTKMANRVNFGKNIALLGAVLIMYMLSLPWPLSLMK